MFRDCVATAIASDDPDHVEIVAALLGHTSPRTAERHYIHAQTLSAGRKHQNMVRDIRNERGLVRRSGFVAPADGIRAVRHLQRTASQGTRTLTVQSTPRGIVNPGIGLHLRLATNVPEPRGSQRSGQQNPNTYGIPSQNDGERQSEVADAGAADTALTTKQRI